jgi:hypothetical protein
MQALQWGGLVGAVFGVALGTAMIAYRHPVARHWRKTQIQFNPMVRHRELGGRPMNWAAWTVAMGIWIIVISAAGIWIILGSAAP